MHQRKPQNGDLRFVLEPPSIPFLPCGEWCATLGTGHCPLRHFMPTFPTRLHVVTSLTRKFSDGATPRSPERIAGWEKEVLHVAVQIVLLHVADSASLGRPRQKMPPSRFQVGRLAVHVFCGWRPLDLLIFCSQVDKEQINCRRIPLLAGCLHQTLLLPSAAPSQ